MAVFRDVSIEYGGRDYVVTPSNKLLRMIEMKGRKLDPSFNIVAIVVQVQSGAGSFFSLAFMLSEFINAAGGKTDEDEALAHLLSFKDPKDMSAYIETIISMIMPEAKDTKKPEADGATATATK
jgi:hypothetical protein